MSTWSTSAVRKGSHSVLALDYHVIAPDLPGFGQTTVMPEVEFNYTFDNLTSVIDAFTVAKSVDRYAMYVFRSATARMSLRQTTTLC